MARENRDRVSAMDELDQSWQCPEVDVEFRQRLLGRALAAGRPAGMRTWAENGKRTLGTPLVSEELH